MLSFFFFFSSRRRHTRSYGDWSSDVCSSDLDPPVSTRDDALRADDRHDRGNGARVRSEEHTSELQSPYDIVCRLLLEKKNKTMTSTPLPSITRSMPISRAGTVSV